jgi:hypothetical protein
MEMPGRDGTGPMGMGAMTGRGLGACTGINAPIIYGGGYGRGCGRGCGRGMGPGFGRGFGFVPNAYCNQPTSKEMLQAQKEQLQNMLDAINKQIGSL